MSSSDLLTQTAGRLDCRTDYRPEVDGLRALAVGLVMLNHLKTSLAPGGFVGVDVFFVISGYVVTRSIARHETDRISADLISFWRRRWLRIQPALLCMLFIGMVTFGLFFPPFPRESYAGILRTGLLASVGLSNFYLRRIGSDYFQADQSANIFTHTWSLAVEEQFYVVYSIVFIGLIRALSPLGLTASVRIWFLGVASLASFALASVWLSNDQMLAYYMLPSRFWELGAGGLLAMVEKPCGRDALGPLLRGIAQAIALVAIGFVCFSASAAATSWTVPVVVAVASTALLIATMRSDDGIGGTVFASTALSGLGLISYAIYLWHYPVFVFFRTNIGTGPVAMIAAVALTLLFAIISYVVIEMPVRKSRAPGPRLAIGFAVAFACLAVAGEGLVSAPGSIYLGVSQDWAKNWLPPQDAAYGPRPGSIVGRVCNLGSGADIPLRIPEACIARSDKNASPPGAINRLLVVGDSHAFASWGMIQRAFEEGAIREWAALGHDGCSPGQVQAVASCLTYTRQLGELLTVDLKTGDAVFAAYLWPINSDRRAALLAHLERLAKVAQEKALTLIIEAPLPQFNRPASLCTTEWYRLNYEGCQIARGDFERSRASMMLELHGLASRSARAVRIWDAASLMCRPEVCELIQDGVPLFRDANHHSYAGARQLAAQFGPWLLGARTGTPEK